MVFKFIKKLALYLLICLGIVTLILETKGHHIDAFYEKFTTPKVNSMIIGDSRGFQDLMPSIINNALPASTYALPIYNYAFTIDQAHIGPHYTKSILRKLTQQKTNGLFLISLTPMMLSSDIKNNNENLEFIEDGAPPHNMYFVNTKPNYEYFIKNIDYFEFKAMFKKEYTVHEDGWMEINHISDDKQRLKEWKNTQMDRFKAMAKTSKPSDYRIRSLDTLVKTLKKYGNVYLLRVPIDQDFLDLETTYFKDFNRSVGAIAEKNNIPYINFGITDSTYFAFDGHHLDKKSAELFSKNVCDSIIKHHISK